MLFCLHGITSLLIPKPWVRKVSIPRAGHVTDDLKVGWQGLPLQKHIANFIMHCTFTMKRQKWPGLSTGTNFMATMPTEHSSCLPLCQAQPKRRNVGSVQISPSICFTTCPGSCCRQTMSPPVCQTGQSLIPAMDHTHIPAPERLAPCHRTRRLQGSTVAV